MGLAEGLSLREATRLINDKLSPLVFVSHLLDVEPHALRRPPNPATGIVVCEVQNEWAIIMHAQGAVFCRKKAHDWAIARRWFIPLFFNTRLPPRSVVTLTVTPCRLKWTMTGIQSQVQHCRHLHRGERSIPTESAARIRFGCS